MSDRPTVEFGKMGHELQFQEVKGEPVPSTNKKGRNCHTYKC